MVSTGLPDFSRTAQVQQGASMVTLIGGTTPAAPTISTTFNIDDKTTLLGFSAQAGWYSPTGPYIWSFQFRFAGNIAGTFSIYMGLTMPAAGSAIQQNLPFDIASPPRLAALLGTNLNTQVTLSCLTALPDGQCSIATNVLLATS